MIIAKQEIGHEFQSLSLIKCFVEYNAFGNICDAGEVLRKSWSEKEEQEVWEEFEFLIVPTLTNYSEMTDFDVWEEYSSFIGKYYLGLTESQFYEKIYEEFVLEEETGYRSYSELLARIELLKRILSPFKGGSYAGNESMALIDN